MSGSRLLFTRGYSVFQWLPRWMATRLRLNSPDIKHEHADHAESWFRSIGADVRNGGNSAHYAVSSDHIQMPAFNAFVDNVSYYSTLAHEHTHWTAQGWTPDRQLGKPVW